MPMSICRNNLGQIVLDIFSLKLTSVVPRCLTTWLKESVRGVHKPEDVESCTVCFKFTPWVTGNTHAPWVPHITKVSKMRIRYDHMLKSHITSFALLLTASLKSLYTQWTCNSHNRVACFLLKLFVSDSSTLWNKCYMPFYLTHKCR